MINFQFFPRSHGVTPEIQAVIDCFKKIECEWLKYCNHQNNQKEMLNKVLELLVLIRKDLQNGSKLKVDDILLNIVQSEDEVKKLKNMK